MATYEINFTINNNTGCTMTLDSSKSEHLGDGGWPQTIGPNAAPINFTQTGNTNVNPTAVYTVRGDYNGSVSMHYYIVGPLPMHVNMYTDFANGAPPFGFSISEDNHNHGTGEGWPKTASTGSNEKSKVELSHTGNDSAHGKASFNFG